MAFETRSRRTKSFEILVTMLMTEAPRTFLIPISLVRCSEMKEAMPNSPRQDMNIASAVKYL